ncbi:MAG TPA: thioredoxin-like domain-containing protein [Pirellulales bacterium]|jgi:thiol-disulfide isomerase/thioredoxin|nr:thioredoxin-like domain-containing protein [Pirellulales bacterium]
MTIHLPGGRVLTALVLSLAAGRGAMAAEAPTAAAALRIKPVQKDVEYDQPIAAEIEKCTIKPEKVAGKSGWLVKNAGGQLLRSFVDTNGDNTVDQWSFYKDGVEIYRDVDTNHNGKKDQCRWLNTAGTRWGIDKNEDGSIDAWQVISPEEASAEVIAALRDADAARFDRLLLTASELSGLGFGKAKFDELEKRIAAAPAGFTEYRKNQAIVGPTTTWAYFGGSRPGIVPLGTDDSTADVTVYDNVAALTDTAGKSGQVPIGTMVKVGNVWRLIDAPGEGSDRSLAGTTLAQTPPADEGGANRPSAKARELMEEYEALDKKQDGSAAANERRVEIIDQLAAEAKTPEDRAQWLRQAADVINEAVPRGKFPGGIERLTEMRDKCVADGQEDLAAYMQFRMLTAAYNKAMTENGDIPTIQKKWLTDLEQFVKDYPKSSDSAEAMLQLGIAEEFAGDDANAVKWYSRVVQNFPKSPSAVKSEGAKRRIESVGNAISLKGKTLNGGKAFDLSELRGRVVLIHYWSSDIDACTNDMAQLERMMKKYGENFIVVGVSLDNDPKALGKYLNENGFFWPQLWEQGGLDGRLANEMGILTLPTMLLIDKHGKVLSRNVSASGLDGELKQILKPQVAARPK